jgi:hypothetical protein
MEHVFQFWMQHHSNWKYRAWVMAQFVQKELHAKTVAIHLHSGQTHHLRQNVVRCPVGEMAQFVQQELHASPAAMGRGIVHGHLPLFVDPKNDPKVSKEIRELSF